MDNILWKWGLQDENDIIQKKFNYPDLLHIWNGALSISICFIIKEFAETGGTEKLDKQPTFTAAKNGGYSSDYDRNRVILDGFSAPPIESGVGISQANLFMDGNHTRVRLRFWIPDFY